LLQSSQKQPLGRFNSVQNKQNFVKLPRSMSWSTPHNVPELLVPALPSAATPHGVTPSQGIQTGSQTVVQEIGPTGKKNPPQQPSSPVFTPWQIGTTVAEPSTPSLHQDSVLFTQTTSELMYACHRVTALENDLHQASLTQGSLSNTIKQQSEQLAVAGADIQGLQATVQFLEGQLEAAQQLVALEQHSIATKRADSSQELLLEQLSSLQAEVASAQYAECALLDSHLKSQELKECCIPMQRAIRCRLDVFDASIHDDLHGTFQSYYCRDMSVKGACMCAFWPPTPLCHCRKETGITSMAQVHGN
jgi:hypothetical protein